MIDWNKKFSAIIYYSLKYQMRGVPIKHKFLKWTTQRRTSHTQTVRDVAAISPNLAPAKPTKHTHTPSNANRPTWRTCLNCSSNDQVCWDEALPSDECELPEEGAAGCGAIGGRKAAAGCGNGNGTGSWKPSWTRPPIPGKFMERVLSKSSWKRAYAIKGDSGNSTGARRCISRHQRSRRALLLKWCKNNQV